MVGKEGGKKGKRLWRKAIGAIMDRAMLLERAYGREVFKKRMAIVYGTSEDVIEEILEGKTFIKRRIKADMEFLETNDGEEILKIAKQFLLNPATKDVNKLVDTVDGIIKERGSGKVWQLKEVGDKGEQGKIYNMEEKKEEGGR